MSVRIIWECDNCHRQLHFESSSHGVEIPKSAMGPYKGSGMVVEEDLLCAYCRGSGALALDIIKEHEEK